MKPNGATPNDYLDLIRLRIDQHISAFTRRVGDIDGECSIRGASGGSAHFLLLVSALKDEFQAGAVDVLRALPVAHQISGINREELLSLTGPRLTEMLSSMISIARLEERLKRFSIPEFQTSMVRHIDECRERIPVLLRQSQIGFDRIWDEGGHAVTNTINTGQIIGGVQQGTVSSTQHISIAVDRVAIESAIENLDKSLSEPSNHVETVKALRADIETIQAQLKKHDPSRVILTEVGKTIRNVVEGVTGGLLTPAASSAALALSAMF